LIKKAFGLFLLESQSTLKSAWFRGQPGGLNVSFAVLPRKLNLALLGPPQALRQIESRGAADTE
jgi:hypothetical protein